MPLDLDLIKRRRLRLKLTLREAGTLAGFGESAEARWHQIEKGFRGGDVALATAEGVARALGCGLEEIVTPPRYRGESPPGGAARVP